MHLRGSNHGIKKKRQDNRLSWRQIWGIKKHLCLFRYVLSSLYHITCEKLRARWFSSFSFLRFSSVFDCFSCGEMLLFFNLQQHKWASMNIFGLRMRILKPSKVKRLSFDWLHRTEKLNSWLFLVGSHVCGSNLLAEHIPSSTQQTT